MILAVIFLAPPPTRGKLAGAHEILRSLEPGLKTTDSQNDCYG